ncbi:hypothetical protein Tco_1101400, partial [Tanacetum coccineum]
MPGRTVIDAAQQKSVKYIAKCAAIRYEFLTFSFSSLGELDKDVVTLLKRIQKFSMVQDIGTRVVVHIFNKINFAIAKEIIFQGKVFWIRAKEVHGWVPDLIEESKEEEQSDVGYLEGYNKTNEDDLCGDNMDMADVPETVFDESNGQKKDVSQDPFGIYPMLNKKTNVKNGKDQSPKYPQRFTPNDETSDNSGIGDKSVNYNADEGTIGGDGVSV